MKQAAGRGGAMVWRVWSVVVDAEVPVKIMVGSACVPFVCECEGRERSSQKMGFSSKMFHCTKVT
jgi:hypothetical protein